MVGDTVSVTVRRASEADAGAVTALLRGIYAEGRWFVGDGPASERHLALRLGGDDPTSSFYGVATMAARVVGWIELHRSPSRRLRHVAVLTLAVAPDARRHGVARALMRAGYDWCRRVGALKVSLNVRAGNDAAVALYRAEGFVLEGREHGAIRLSADEERAAAARHDAAARSLPGFEDNLIMGKWL